MKPDIKYTICVQGTRDDWFYNGKYLGHSDVERFFIFYDEKDDWNYHISWDKLIWFKEARKVD